MRKSLGFALRIVVLLAILASLSTVIAPTAPTQAPYRSALSDIAASPAYAAGCPDKLCSHGIECVSGIGFKCIRFNGKGCTATPCG
jgi:hypothetical protein